jgi:hypothetical protein
MYTIFQASLGEKIEKYFQNRRKISVKWADGIEISEKYRPN